MSASSDGFTVISTTKVLKGIILNDGTNCSSKTSISLHRKKILLIVSDSKRQHKIQSRYMTFDIISTYMMCATTLFFRKTAD